MERNQNIVTRIAMWSTALMWSWKNRPDIVVIDEPLHGVDIKLGNWQYEVSEEILDKNEAD